MSRLLIVLMPLIGGFCWALSTTSLAASWVSSHAITLEPLSAIARQRLSERLATRTLRNHFEERYVDWQIHRGDLRIDNSLENDQALGAVPVTGSGPGGLVGCSHQPLSTK